MARITIMGYISCRRGRSIQQSIMQMEEVGWGGVGWGGGWGGGGEEVGWG